VGTSAGIHECPEELLKRQRHISMYVAICSSSMS